MTLSVVFTSRSAANSTSGDATRDGQRIRVGRFSSSYPGGHADASFVIIRDPTEPLPFSLGDRVQVYDGPRVVWQGDVVSTDHYTTRTESGVRVNALGLFGSVLARRVKDKRWADNRLTADAWHEPRTAFSSSDQTLAQIMTLDRVSGRIRFTPKAVAFSSGWFHRVRYSMPIGETIKRIRLSFDMREAGQAWELLLWNEASSAAVGVMSVSGPGTIDETLATPTRHAFISFRAASAQTPASDGTVYGQIDDAISGITPLVVYSETGAINAYEVARDIRAMVTELSTDESLISSTLTATVEPFYTTGPETLADILGRICSYGTPSFEPIGYGVWGSTLFVERWPALTGYDYLISMRDPELSSGLSVVRDVGSVTNYVSYTYTDPSGQIVTVTPDDDANLRSQTSIDAYGRRDIVLSLNQTSATAALRYARQYLAATQHPQVYISGQVKISGTISGVAGERVPVSYVRAGQRVKLADFISDVIGVSGAGLTAVITLAEYTDDDKGGVVSLSFGVPDNLAVLLARMSLRLESWVPGPPQRSRDRRG